MTRRAAEAGPIVGLLTRGQMADAFIISTDVAEGDYIGPALDMVAKRGKVVVTGSTRWRTSARATRTCATG